MRTPHEVEGRTIWIMAPVLAISIDFLMPKAEAHEQMHGGRVRFRVVPTI